MVVCRIQILQLVQQSVSLVSQVVQKVLELWNLVLLVLDVVLKRENATLKLLGPVVIVELALLDVFHSHHFSI